MVNPVQAAVGIIVLLVTVGALLYIFYSRTNAVEKTGYGALIMLSIIALMIPGFWIVESNNQASAQLLQHNLAVQRGAQLFSQYCFQCHGLNGQGLAGPKLNGSTTVNGLSDADIIRIISAGVPASVDPTTLAKLQMPAWLDQYGGPLTQTQIQYLFALIRSADPAYLAKNGFPTGPGTNGFDQVPGELKSSNPTAYQTAVAQATAGAGVGQFGTPVDMTNKNAVTINIVNSPSGATCTPACFEILNVKVKVGTTITWVNKSSTIHTATAIVGENPSVENPASKIFDSGAGTPLLAGTGTYTYKVTMAAYNFNKDHAVVYYCQFHPSMVALLTIVP
jgi:plastocyanin/mono/diheme cytochrome c family protein